MEIPDWSQTRLIQEGADMKGGDHHHHHHQDQCCCCCRGGGGGGGIAAGYELHHALSPSRKETRLLRVAQLLVAGLLLLTAASLALLFAVGLQVRCVPKEEEDRQVRPDLSGSPVEVGGKSEMSKLQGDSQRPLAIVTAPRARTLLGNRLNWESQHGVICRGGFLCTDSALHVPRTGVYRVFLQITWRVDDAKTHPKADLNLKGEVIVFRDSYQLEKVVLSMVDIAERSAPWWKSLYASKLVKLDDGNKLKVNSTFPKLVSLDENQVFFGAEFVE